MLLAGFYLIPLDRQHLHDAMEALSIELIIKSPIEKEKKKRTSIEHLIGVICNLKNIDYIRK